MRMNLLVNDRPRRRVRAVVVVACAMLGACLPVVAQDSPPAGNGNGISVAGAGEVKAKPNVVEINATVAGDAELAADAIVKYRDSRKRAVEALNGLKVEGLKVESGGFTVNQGMDPSQAQAMMQGNAPPAGKSRVTVSEQLRIVIAGVDKLGDEEVMDTVLKVLDTGRDAGLQIGRQTPRNYVEMQNYNNSGPPQPLVQFKLTSPDALREKAYQQAMDDARKRGGRLATLANVKLARIVAVRESADGKADGGGNAGQPPGELTSSVFKEIPVRVNLSVRFEIEK
jgi:uncharacterized protein YggE